MQRISLPSVLLTATFLLCGFLANLATWKAVDEVNPHLSESQRFSQWWWTITKHARLWKEHKRLCPHSHWRLYMVLSFAGGSCAELYSCT